MSAAPPPGTRLSQTGSIRAGDTLSGKYEVERLLGEGGMGEVYVARDRDLGRKVALKVLRGGPTSDEERLRREARTLAAIGHPNIVQIFEIGHTPAGAPFLVMELLEGETLYDLSLRERHMSVKRAVGIVSDVLSTLAVVHAKGIVHRDMKPENVFLARDAAGREIVKLLDLGIAKDVVASPDTPALTETGVIVGTPHYMAPEQAYGVADIDGRADLYAVGGILYTLLAGKTPFAASNVIALLRMIVDTDPLPVEQIRDDLPPGLGAVIAKAMARDRKERWQDAQSFLAALEPYATDTMRSVPAVPTSPTLTAPAVAPSRRGLLGPALALLAVVLVGAFVLSIMSPDGDDRPAGRLEPAPQAKTPAPAPAPAARKEAAPRPRPRRAFLSVNVTPATATVTLDGAPLRDGGFVLEPSERPRVLVAEAPGHERYESRLIVQANERVNVVLQPTPTPAGAGRPLREREPGTWRGKLGISKNPFPGRGSSR